MFHRFTFESEFYPSLSRVPVSVRMKLDRTGVKISLDDWLAFDFEERRVLCHLPVDAEEELEVFISYLDHLSRKHRGRPARRTAPLASSVWDKAHPVPSAVIAKSAATGRPVSAEEWTRWQSLQRYVLYKTALSKNDTNAFYSVLDELRACRE